MLYSKEMEGTKAKKINLCKSQYNNFVQKENHKIMQSSIMVKKKLQKQYCIFLKQTQIGSNILKAHNTMLVFPFGQGGM